MKKLVLAIAVIASFASCEKQAQVEETGAIKVAPIVKTSTDGSVAKKGAVNRGDVPVYVSAINVNTNMAGRTTDTHFDIVDDGSGVDGFEITDVPLGTNVIAAITEPSAPVLRKFFQVSGADYSFGDGPSLTEDQRGLVLSEVVKTLNAAGAHYTQNNIPPYAIYTGSTTVDLVEGLEITAPINMDTQYGRTYFSIATENAADMNDYTVKIRATFYDVDGNQVYSNPVTYASGTQLAIGIWSDEKSVGGSTIKLDFEWYADVDLNTVLNSKSVTLNVNAKEDAYVAINLKRSTFVLEKMGLNFAFDPIVVVDDEIKDID